MSRTDRSEVTSGQPIVQFLSLKVVLHVEILSKNEAECVHIADSKCMSK